MNSRDQIVVNDPVNAHEGAIVANASTNTGYGPSADVNSVEIDGTPHDVTDSSVDNINTIGI